MNPQDFYQDQALTNVSIKYTNDQFIADRVFPVIPVAKQTGKYYVYDKANLRLNKTLRAPGSPANEVGFGVSTASFITVDHALKEFVPDEVAEQADSALSPLVDAAETVTEQLMLDREQDAASILFSTANLTQNTTLSGSSQWSNSASTPIEDVRTARATIQLNSFRKPNTIIMGQQVMDQLSEHPEIIARIQYSQIGVITEDILAKAFRVDNVLVGTAGYNSAVEGQTDAMGYVWGKNAVVAYIAPNPGLRQPTLGYTFQYKTRIVERWRDEDRKGTYVRVGNDNYVHKVVAPTCGYLIAAAVA